MKLLILVLNKVEELEHLLERLERNSIRGATILSSRGMAMALENYMSGSFLGSLRAVMEPDRAENRTIFMALRDDQVPVALNAIDEVIDLTEPNTGVAFTLPIDFIKGVEL
ncbi:MAG: hypothetical protein MSH10_08250 [Pygmaiobacter massiliensis]|nr:hypothetical protein [Pygmaiobacter massiliensis]